MQPAAISGSYFLLFSRFQWIFLCFTTKILCFKHAIGAAEICPHSVRVFCRLLKKDFLNLLLFGIPFFNLI